MANAKPTTAAPNILAIIPARSRDVMTENGPLILAGQPLLEYTVKAALASTLIRRTVVNTDGEEVAALARKFGADVPFIRDPRLAGETVELESVLVDCLTRIEQDGPPVDVVVLLEASHPVRPAGLIDKVITALLDSDLDSVFTAYEDRHRYWIIDDRQGLRPVLSDEGTRGTRQPLFRELSGLVCASRADVVRRGAKLGRKVGIVPVRTGIGLVDTQDHAGTALAEFLLARM